LLLWLRTAGGDRIPEARGSTASLRWMVSWLVRSKTGAHVEFADAVGVDVGPEQGSQGAPIFVCHPGGPLRFGQNLVDQEGVDVHEGRLEVSVSDLVPAVACLLQVAGDPFGNETDRSRVGDVSVAGPDQLLQNTHRSDLSRAHK